MREPPLLKSGTIHFVIRHLCSAFLLWINRLRTGKPLRDCKCNKNEHKLITKNQCLQGGKGWRRTLYFPHVNHKCFRSTDLWHPSLGSSYNMQTRIIALKPHMEIRRAGVKWNLGGNVSWTHLRDRSTVKWPLNSKTALFIWSLIDGPVIFIHSLSCQTEQILVWPLFFLTCFPLFTHMQHHCGIEEPLNSVN